MRIIKNTGKSEYLDLSLPSGEATPVDIDVSNFVFGETPNGTINGINATFTTDFNFIPETVEVFIGIRLTVIQDYITIGTNTIQFTSSPLSGENIQVNYVKV